MKIAIAPDKYKGSLSGREFCDIVAKELKTAFPEARIIRVPLADGGDGTLDVLKDQFEAKVVTRTVNDPLFRPVQAGYLFSKSKKLAFIEMAEASGHWRLQPKELDCMQTSTLGTGELIANALSRGAREVYLGIGGSATNDGGMGVAQALGYNFLDKKRKQLSPIGANLGRVTEIVLPTNNLLNDAVFKVACDVDNPFYGENGAAHVYASQKGASKEEIEILDEGLKHFAAIVKEQMGIDLQKIPGTGAAGGLGGGAVAFLNAELLSGIDLVKKMVDFDNKIEGADWIITGEGKLDNQTLSGKTIGGVLKSAKKLGIKVAAFCGKVALSKKEVENLGVDYVVSVSEGMPTLKEAMAKTEENLKRAVKQFAGQIREHRYGP